MRLSVDCDARIETRASLLFLLWQVQAMMWIVISCVRQLENPWLALRVMSRVLRKEKLRRL
jgi:hypothetical protein